MEPINTFGMTSRGRSSYRYWSMAGHPKKTCSAEMTEEKINAVCRECLPVPNWRLGLELASLEDEKSFSTDFAGVWNLSWEWIQCPCKTFPSTLDGLRTNNLSSRTKELGSFALDCSSKGFGIPELFHCQRTLLVRQIYDSLILRFVCLSPKINNRDLGQKNLKF